MSESETKPVGLKSILESNEAVRPNTEFLEELRAHFPRFFDAQGNFKSEKFAEELKESNVSEALDGYKLEFTGKNYARLQAGLASEKMIVPDNNHNSKDENKDSQNIFITGDNLEALRHLQNAYSGKIKMIYIDPPYNKGKDFTYSDKFKFSDKELRDALGYSDDEIKRLKSIQGKSSHSAWLTFMYPRLKLAQKLLRDDGVIFVSIDDNEQANLKLLMDDVFGEGNFCATVHWRRNRKPHNAGTTMSTSYEFVLVYYKSEKFKLIQEFSEMKADEKGDYAVYPVIQADKQIRTYTIKSGTKCEIHSIHKGVYRAGRNEDLNIEYLDSTSTEDGRTNNDIRLKARFRLTDESGKLSEAMRMDNIFINQNGVPKEKRYRSDDDNKVDNHHWDIEKGRNEDGDNEIRALFELSGMNKLFSYPKPVALVKKALSTINEKDFIVLDFFAGSGTTAHAVMQLNAEDGGNRKFILFQLDEATKAEKRKTERKADGTKESQSINQSYKTIDEIARKRIELVAAKIKSEKGLFSKDLDLGFKHYRLIDPDIQTKNRIREFDPNSEQQDFHFDDMLTPFTHSEMNASGSQTLLTTWLIDDGNPFDTPIEEIKLAGYAAHYVRDSATMYLIDRGWSTDALMELLSKIGTHELSVNTIVIFPYSFSFESIQKLKTTFRTNQNNSPNLIERY